jgi:cytochrome c
MTPAHSRHRLALVLVAALAALTGCGGERFLDPPAAQLGVAVGQGREAIVRYGCGSCHMIPGIRLADSGVAPPLIAWSQRAFVGGRLPNTPGNLIRWIRNPQEVDPGSPMPNLGVTDDEARHIAAYLLTLR